MSGTRQQAGEGLYAIRPAGVDEAHEKVTGSDAIERLEAEVFFATEDRHLEGVFRTSITTNFLVHGTINTKAIESDN